MTSIKSQTIRKFITKNREGIDAAILKQCSNCKLDDAERRLWILSDEDLYLWAKSEGVKI